MDGGARRMRALTGYDRVTLSCGERPRESSRGAFAAPADTRRPSGDHRRRRPRNCDLPAGAAESQSMTRCCARQTRDAQELAAQALTPALHIPFCASTTCTANSAATTARRGSRASSFTPPPNYSPSCSRCVWRSTAKRRLAAEDFLARAKNSSPPGIRRRSRSRETPQAISSAWRTSGRRFDEDSSDQVAPAAAVEDTHPRTAVAQLLARLDAGRDLELDLMAVNAGQAIAPPSAAVVKLTGQSAINVVPSRA